MELRFKVGDKAILYTDSFESGTEQFFHNGDIVEIVTVKPIASASDCDYRIKSTVSGRTGGCFDYDLLPCIKEKSDSVEQVEYFTGKLLCLESYQFIDIKKGKVYEVENGVLTSLPAGTVRFPILKDLSNAPWWFIEYLGLAREGYNGTIVCIESRSSAFTCGKAYRVIDGQVYDNDNSSDWGIYKTFEDIEKKFNSKFIELVED